MKNKIFDSYAKYYDLIYKDKDYVSEVDYVESLIKKFGGKCKSILDLGSGTGRHAFLLAGKGYDVTGVELSEEMYNAAVSKKGNSKDKIVPEFLHGDLNKVKTGRKYDVILMLFHVMSYQTSNEDVKRALSSVREHLEAGGIFIFDFWYGPAVLIQKPERRSRIFEDEDFEVARRAIPDIRYNENTVEVNYDISVRSKKFGNSEDFSERHSMRYFFLPEIENLLDAAGMTLTHSEEWMTGNTLSEKSWSALCVSCIK